MQKKGNPHKKKKKLKDNSLKALKKTKKKSLCNKICYTKERAQHALKKLKPLDQGYTRFYYCKDCKAHHLTSMDRKTFKEVQKMREEREEAKEIYDNNYNKEILK